MTEYQKIENELLSLGWEKEAGNGDHVKFVHEGNPNKIIVSINVDDKARALRNTYAQIRRAEPRFSLGRQPHMLQHDACQEDDTLPSGLQQWMKPDEKVRWSAPENRDYTKLLDTTSIMNREYVIEGYNQTQTGTMVVIQDANAPDEKPFPVFPDELDRFPLVPCTQCGKLFPQNVLALRSDGTLLCPDCLKEIQDAPSVPDGLRDSVKENELPTKERILQELTKREPDLGAILADYTTFMDANKDGETKTETAKRIMENYSSLPSKKKKILKKDFPEVVSFIENAALNSGQVEEPVTPYEAWRRVQRRLAVFAVFRANATGKMRKQIEQEIFSATYTVGKLAAKNDKKRKVADVITIATKNWDTALLMWETSSVLYANFEPLQTDLPIVFLLNCPSAGLSQYILPTQQPRANEVLKILRENLPDEDLPKLERADMDILLPSIDKVNDLLRTEAGITKNDGTAFSITRSIRESDHDIFETAKPFYECRIMVNTTDPKVLPGLKDNFKKDKERIVRESPIRIICDNDADGESFELDWIGEGFDEAATEAREPKLTGEFGFDDNEMLLRILVSDKKNDDYLLTIPDMDEGTDSRREFVDTIANLFIEIIENDTENPVAEALRAVNGHITRKKGNNMETTDILSRTNEHSSNPAAGGLTTLELLKELKERGMVIVDGKITFVVREDVDLDKI